LACVGNKEKVREETGEIIEAVGICFESVGDSGHILEVLEKDVR